ncbi:hypothetical protein Q7P35_009129 [Cladosporium inversicolor]
MSELHLPPQELAYTTAFRFTTPPHSLHIQRLSATLALVPELYRNYHDGRLSENQVGTYAQIMDRHRRTVALDSLVNIPELFEEVLAQLPLLDLVIATGVNTTFRGFIFSSQKLKRKLFLLPTKPQGSRKQRKQFDPNGIFGPSMCHDECLNSLAGLNSPSVTLCPFLLEPSHRMRMTHLTARAAEAHLWPHIYLTDPPCAHAHVNFTFGGTNAEGLYVLLEAGRSIYRRDGVTCAAIQEALEQSGSVKVSHGGLVGSKCGRLKVGQKHVHAAMYNTTARAQVAMCEKRYKCKLSLVLKDTTIKLYGDPVTTKEAVGSMVPVGGIQALYMNARKIRFED